ncbi:MAG: hypothetical protein ACE5GW_13470 [Planctomycetota bacterium]
MTRVPPSSSPVDPRSAALPRALLCAAGLLLLAAAPGCGTAAQAKKDPDRTAGRRLLLSYERIYQVPVAKGAEATLLGFLGRGIIDVGEEKVGICKVFDRDFLEAGFCYDNGATYRFMPSGEAEFVGNHTLDRSIGRILESEGPFRRVDGLE